MDKILKQNSITDLDFAEYLDSLLLRGESVDIEFKMASNGFPNSLWETYSSFANTDGGTIVLGVREKGMQLFVEGLSHEQVVSYKLIYFSFINVCTLNWLLFFQSHFNWKMVFGRMKRQRISP